MSNEAESRLPLGRQLLYQVLCLLILATVLLPVLWILSMSLDPRDLSRPTSFLPEGASLKAYQAVIEKPTPNPVSFWELARNSFLLAGGVSAAAVVVGVTAAYAFSRFRFPGREAGMLSFVIVLMLPAVASLAALFVMLNILLGPSLRNSLVGVGLAMTAGALPFAIWNLKGYIDTVPKDLEEAAAIDGATPHQAFMWVILPMVLPALAVTVLFGFMAGWTEFALSWQFISNPTWFTLSMALYGMQGQYASNTPWSQFAAMSILVSAPVVIVFFALQKYIVGGLTAGGVKG
jgi:arabinogalactan oligomer/maltooligosaccharide transport system permease protein